MSLREDKPCWSTYRQKGLKKKGDRMVPNCVPKESINEVLDISSPMGDWIKDFQNSDNPKFKGKSQEKRREMAIAAYLEAKRNRRKSQQRTAMDEEVEIDDENILELNQQEMDFFTENGLIEATLRNTKKLIQRLHDREQGQTYGGNPYSSHPKAVMRLGIRVFGGKRFDQNVRKAALLHDTIEDTPTTPEMLLKRGFHPDVVKAVQLLSKDKTKSYEDNIDNIANGNTPAHKIAQHVKYVDNMSNYLEEPKREWDQDRIEKQKGKYMASMERLGRVLGVDAHTKLKPKWKLKTEEVDLDEMTGANMSRRDLVSHIKKKGWTQKTSGSSGDHEVYTHSKSTQRLAIPRHNKLKTPLVLDILKKAKMMDKEMAEGFID
jgi:predicted RNA binding protein YcfA (HicA-like mRNA interferase family)